MCLKKIYNYLWKDSVFRAPTFPYCLSNTKTQLQLQSQTIVPKHYIFNYGVDLIVGELVCATIALTIIINMLNQQQITFNKILPGSQQPGFSAVYRKKGVEQLLTSPAQNIHSAADILRHCRDKYGHKKGLGQVVVTVEKGPNGENIETRTVKEYTYNWVYQTAYNLGKALAHRNMAVKEDLYGLRVLGIYSRNRLEWFLADWACSIFGYVLAPLYDSLGKENFAHCINISGTKTLFISSHTANQLSKFHQKSTLKTLVLFDKLSEELTKTLTDQGLELIFFWDLIEEGKNLPDPESIVTPKREDLFSFCFTSGTTGPPKASMIKNSNLLAALVPFLFHEDVKFSQNDVHLSYLPLPHLMERSIIYGFFYAGGFVCISSGNILKIKEDAAVAQVTLFVSVPRVYNKIVDGVKATLDGLVKDEAQRPAISEAVFQKVRQSFGGKIRLTVTGSAPINAAVQNYMQGMFKCPMIEGYGQTESPCGILFSRAAAGSLAAMHELSAAVEIRLADIPEMRYTSQDKDIQGRSTPRGEICVRGPQVFGGYYKREDLTKDAIGTDGWLRTGDVGEITPDLAFKIIDRKKNIFKLQQGQYIAPDRVEAVYMRAELLQEMFLHGSSNQNYAVAVATPRKDKLAQIAAKVGVQGSVEQLCKNHAVRVVLLTELNIFARSNGLLGYELAKNIYLQPVGFAPRKILTNTQKLIRFQAKVSYTNEIEGMYGEGELKI